MAIAWLLRVVGYFLIIADDPSILLKWNQCHNCKHLEMNHANDDSKECLLCKNASDCPGFVGPIEAARRAMEERRRMLA